MVQLHRKKYAMMPNQFFSTRNHVQKENVWPETCFGVKIISFRELLKTSSRSLFRRRFWLLGGRCRQKSLGMVNACVRDRDAVVRVPFAVSKHYLCCSALVCAIVFATVWSGITADGRVSVKINCIWSTRAIGPTDTVRICSWCDHSKTHMPFTNDFLYLKTGARTNAPQTSNTCLLSQRKRQTGALGA